MKGRPVAYRHYVPKHVSVACIEKLRRCPNTSDMDGVVKACKAMCPWLPSGDPGARLSATRVGWVGNQRPRSLRKRFVYCSAVVLGTELQVGEADPPAHGVSRSSDQKCTPASLLVEA